MIRFNIDRYLRKNDTTTIKSIEEGTATIHVKKKRKQYTNLRVYRILATTYIYRFGSHSLNVPSVSHLQSSEAQNAHVESDQLRLMIPFLVNAQPACVPQK